MNLQIALVVVSMVLVMIIYLVSVRLDKHNTKSKSAGLCQYNARESVPGFAGSSDGLGDYDPDDDIPVARMPEAYMSDRKDDYGSREYAGSHPGQGYAPQPPARGYREKDYHHAEDSEDKKVGDSEHQYPAEIHNPGNGETDIDPMSQRQVAIENPQADSDIPILESPILDWPGDANEQPQRPSAETIAPVVAEKIESKSGSAVQPDQRDAEPGPVHTARQRNRGGSMEERIEPRLVSPDAPENSDLPNESSSIFVYPEIPGFGKISQIDYWVRIYGHRDVGRESVLAQYREAKSALSKFSRVHGLKIPEKSWRNLEHEHEDARFGDLVVTIQLADQHGPIDAAELARFSHLIAKLSEGTGRSFTFMAPVESALRQAKALADFVRCYESVFVVNVKSRDTDHFHGNAINRCAMELGLERSANNYYVRNQSVGKGKVCLYSLANMSDSGEFNFGNLKELRTRGVTFFTRPAVTRSPGAVFAEMVGTAKAFAGRIKGEAIAPHHETLSQDDVAQIRQSIEKVAREMEQQGMAPGSDEAMRVF